VLDEVANAAFFYGMMAGMSEQVEDIRDHLIFADVKSNFLAAAREGIRAQMNWFNDTHLPAKQLVLEQLLPMAREGLQEAGIDQDDIDRYLGVIQDRVSMRRTGARWALESLETMSDSGTLDQRLRCIVSSMVDQQSTGKPISEWELAHYSGEEDWRDSYRTVGQFMTQDLFTVRPDDIVDFAATLMDWRHIRHVPVESDTGKLVGLVSHRELLRLVAQGGVGKDQRVTVEEIMVRNPVTVHPDTPTVDAIRIMREWQLACLPVIRENKLVGIVTEHDLIVVASHLLESQLVTQE
jgi:CBS domain-containing protein